MGVVGRAFTASNTGDAEIGIIGKIKVQFTAVVARDARRCLVSNGTQDNSKKGDDVTRRKQRHTQSCVHDEAKRCTVGNFPDVETRVGKFET